MMPVAKGAKSTRLQILIYSLLFVPVRLAPALHRPGRRRSTWPWRALGGAVFLLLASRLFRSQAGDEPTRPTPRNDDGLYDVKADAKAARNLFAFSILYLFALFATLLVEHARRRCPELLRSCPA